MNSILNGDNLTRKNGTIFNVFNQRSKIEKLKAPYKIILKSSIEKFLKKTTNNEVNNADVLQHLKTLKLINDKITNNNDYKLIVNKALDDKYNVGTLSNTRTRKTKITNDALNERVLTILTNDLKNLNTKITLDEVITHLLNNNIIKNKSELSFKLRQQMAIDITKHNNEWYKKQVKMYKIGKYEYHLTATSIVWSEEEGQYSDERYIGFKSDLKTEDITIDIITDIVEKHYSELDYPYFLMLNRHKIITLNGAKDIKDIKLFNFGDNKRYNNEYIQSPNKYINGWGNVADTEHQKKCVNLLLRGQLYKLVERHLIPAKILSDEHINKFFNGEFTIKNIIKFFQTQLNNYGTIYIYDPTGQVLIDSYIGNKQEATATIDANINDKDIKRKYTRSVIGIMNGDHIDPITEQNVKRSITNGERLNIFDMPFKNDDLTFELYEHPEKLACDDTYNEYNADGIEKNKNADIILFQDDTETYNEVCGYGAEKSDADIILINEQLPTPTPNIYTDPITGEITIKMLCRNTDVKNLLYKISNHTNMIITNPIFNGRDLTGFIHPITKQQYIKTTDFYKRKKACDIMFEALGYNQLKFKNQSLFEIAKLFMEYFDLGNFGALLCYHTVTQRENYIQHNIHQITAQTDDDVLKNTHKPKGTDNTITEDFIKAFSAILLYSNDVWLLPSPYDVYEDFDINNDEHLKIPFGEYILYAGSYGHKLSPIKWTANGYSYGTIRDFLHCGYIKFKDIKYIRKIKNVLPANYFKNFVKTAYKMFDESTAKSIINTFIGGLNQLTTKTRHATYTDNQEVAIALNNKYTECGYVSHLIPSLYDELYFISFQKKTPNYHTATAIWRQIQERNIWQIENVIHSVLYDCPTVKFIAVNADSVTLQFPCVLSLENEIKNIKNKSKIDVLDKIGTIKIEDTIKRKGHPFSYVNEIRNDIITEPVKKTTIYRKDYIYEKYNTDFLQDVKNLNSCLITAKGAGYGKSCLLLLLYNDDTDLILVPQHANKSSLKAEAKRLNIKLTDKNIHVMADYFNDDMTLNEQINKFKNYNKVLIDEIYQCNQTDIYKLYQVKTRFNLVIIGAGDPRQIPTPNPNNDSYDLTNNTFFTNELFDGNNIVLNYLKECGRFEDETPDILNVLCDTHKIPDIFKNATLDHWRHLTLTKKKRDYINIICSKNFCKNKCDGGMLEPEDKRIINIDNGYCYGVNMLLTSSGNKSMYHIEGGYNKTFIMKNKHVYKIVDINVESMEFNIYCINTNILIQNIPIFKIQNFFIPCFASTVDSVQGSRINEAFSIWEMDSKYFNLNRVNSAIGRTINKNLVFLDLQDKNKYFNWHEYQDIIIVNPMPKNNDPLYANTWHYEIKKNDNVIYVGFTTRTIEERLKEHWHTAQNNPRDGLHKHLINCDKTEITITTIKHPTPIKHRNKGDAERFENEHIKFYSENNELLNTKTNIREYKKKDPIKITDINDDDLLTMEQYNEIKNTTDKQIKPTIYDDAKEHKIVVYYTMNKTKHKTSFKYKLCGIENAMKKANDHIDKLREDGTFNTYTPQPEQTTLKEPQQEPQQEPEQQTILNNEHDILKNKLIKEQRDAEALIILKKQNELYRKARLVEKQDEHINLLSNQIIRECYKHNLNTNI